MQAWAGQAAAFARGEPAAELVLRLWQQAQAFRLPRPATLRKERLVGRVWWLGRHLYWLPPPVALISKAARAPRATHVFSAAWRARDPHARACRCHRAAGPNPSAAAPGCRGRLV